MNIGLGCGEDFPRSVPRLRGCIADFPIRQRNEPSRPCRLGSRRHSRFGNLRYFGCGPRRAVGNVATSCDYSGKGWEGKLRQI